MPEVNVLCLIEAIHYLHLVSCDLLATAVNKYTYIVLRVERVNTYLSHRM